MTSREPLRRFAETRLSCAFINLSPPSLSCLSTAKSRTRLAEIVPLNETRGSETRKTSLGQIASQRLRNDDPLTNSATCSAQSRLQGNDRKRRHKASNAQSRRKRENATSKKLRNRRSSADAWRLLSSATEGETMQEMTEAERKGEEETFPSHQARNNRRRS